MSNAEELREQEGWPKPIAAAVYELKKRATKTFHDDHDDGDLAIYQLLDDLAELVVAHEAASVQAALKHVDIADRAEWYMRGISSVAIDLINGKDVELTLERANQRTAEWQKKHDDAIKALQPKEGDKT